MSGPIDSIESPRYAAPQRGIALIIGLVILAVLSMIGVAAFSISTQEERMAGNSRDRMRAFEAAEAALRSCENFVATGPAFNNLNGMYVAPPSDQPSIAEQLSTPGNQQTWLTSGATYIDQALNTQAAAGQWNQAPACVVEQFSVLPATFQLGQAITPVSMAHITARGYGLNAKTIVTLESYDAL